MNVRASVLTLMFALTPVLAMAHDYTQGAIKIDHPWSRPTPPGTPMGVGYLAISNNSDSAITLTGANTPRAGAVSIHESSMSDGVMRMRPLAAGLTIPAGATVELKPHGYHLMLEALKGPLQAGERIPLTLRFDHGGEIEVELAVEPMEHGDMDGQDDHSGHGDHAGH